MAKITRLMNSNASKRDLLFSTALAIGGPNVSIFRCPTDAIHSEHNLLYSILNAVQSGGIGGGSSLPSQAGQQGKFLSTDGANPLWASGIDQNNVAITGGTINGTAIGGTTPAAGTFTTLIASTGGFSTTFLGVEVTGPYVYANKGAGSQVRIGNSGVVFGLSDLGIFQEDTNTLAQRNGTNAQASLLYNTYTDATTNEFLKSAFESNVARIVTVKGSVGGTARDLALGTDNTDLLVLTAAGYIVPVLPTSASGLPTGALWNNGGVVNVA